MPAPASLPLLAFGGCAVLVFMHALVLAAGLPARPCSDRRARGRGARMDAALWGLSGTVALGLAVATVAFALANLAWAHAVIVAGLAFLAAPFALRLLPLAAIEGRRGLILFAAASTVALLALLGRA